LKFIIKKKKKKDDGVIRGHGPNLTAATIASPTLNLGPEGKKSALAGIWSARRGALI